ncbi:polysaccharide lyase 8 family protein [Allokutzneria sp. A3M-2-11 16]|uniref:polysaccharide lyase 8 family protein n=1 Tax=Allokutzneria sp. A3M-2-11 16 TaxID=2962043 RepID=UPI0020B771F4|nr:polysaccharide lyase 8 family protein [Allokutzneria sp. A3M-2-11 16]MCP3798743.1 polysaccharide lyase 8 family protein [Allokutzneria sp. A3M-2-11 16]
MSTGRWLDLLTGGKDADPGDPVIAAAIERAESRARTLLSTMDRSPGRTSLWPDLPGPGVEHTTASLSRLRAMALSASTRDVVTEALEWIARHRYREDMDEVGNWWEWEIGIPNLLLDTVVLSGARIPALLRAVRRFVPDPTRRTANPAEEETGANRADKAYIHLRRGLLSDDTKLVEEARRALDQVYEYVISGDGFYRDGSFVQHQRHAYTGTYGVVLLGSVARTLAVLGDPIPETVERWVFDSFEPITFRGQVMSFTRGRSITRSTDDHAWGRQLVSALTLLSSKKIGPLIGSLVQSGAYQRTASAAEIVLLRKAVAPPVQPKSSHHTFANMDRAVHHRGDWVFAISARSNRINGYESGNGENLRGWYTGEGMTYLYNNDLQHYSGDFWSTVDTYRLPGTTTATAATHPRTPADNLWFGGFRGPDKWVGGVTLDHDNGSFGMQFTAGPDQLDNGLPGAPNSLRGTKSWFMFGDEIVALGAGITSEDGDIITTVENRRTSARFTTGPGWAHLAGVGGYVFPANTNVRSETGEYAVLLFDHGRNPRSNTYQYVLLPGCTAEETAEHARNPKSVVLGNTAKMQAVRHGGTLAVNFYEPGAIEDLSADNPAAIVFDRRTLAVSDPTRSQEPLVLHVFRPELRVSAADPGVLVTELPRGLRITVDAAAGKTYRVRFA